MFATTVNYIEEKVTPELTDEFVKENLTETYGWQTADELLAQLRSDLQWNATAQYLWTTLLDQAKVSEVPQSMIDYQLDRTLAEYKMAAQSYGMTLEQALSSVGVSDREELGEKYADDLKDQALQGLVMQAVAEDADIDVSEEDVAAYFKDFMYLDDYSSYNKNYGDGFVRMTVLNLSLIQICERRCARPSPGARAFVLCAPAGWDALCRWLRAQGEEQGQETAKGAERIALDDAL